jgi:hypothetical protein
MKWISEWFLACGMVPGGESTVGHVVDLSRWGRARTVGGLAAHGGACLGPEKVQGYVVFWSNSGVMFEQEL